MLKDPKEFRKRFAAYKAGKMPYKDGRIVLEDEWDPNDTYTADAGMIKSKLAIASHFGNPTARRMTNYDGRDYTWPGEYEYINGVGEPKRGNVYVGSYDNLVTPQIQDNGKTLELVDDLWTPENKQRSYRQSLKFNKMRDAWSFGENYKKYAPMMNRYEDGLTPYKKSEVNTNLVTYNPEEDLYTGRYTLPEVTVTGDKSKRVYRSHAPRTSGMSKNYQKWDTTDLLSAMATGSDVGDAVDIGKDLYNQNYINAGIGAAMFAVPNFIEKPLKPVGRFARNFIINNNDKISTLLAKSGVVKRAMNYAMHLTDAANPTYYILRDIGIKGYGSRNPNNVSIDQIKSFLLDRSKDKTKLKLVASYILFGKNKNKVIKDHTGIVGIDYQTNKTFNTSPESGFIGPKESVLFGKDMTAGKIENFADYGVHSDYIMHRPDLTPRRIYSTDAPYRNGLPTVDDNFITHTIPRTLSSLDDYMPIKTPFGIGSYDAGGHLIELGRGVDKKYYLRGLDIYKFDAIDYAKKHLDAFNDAHDYLQWAKQHPFLNLGLTTVLKAVKPIIVRSRWTPVDQVLDSHLTPSLVKKQIRLVYDQLNQSALMYLVPRMNSYIK